jgi:hypothetical protein
MSNIKDSFYTYDELKIIVNRAGIKTKEQYINQYDTLKSEKGIRAPFNPKTFYGSNIWNNWSEFLNKPINRKKFHNIYYKYEECKKVIASFKLSSKSDFFRRIKDIMNNNNRIPYNPYKTYKGEWESWGEFLGTKKIQDNLKVYLSFDDARLWARSLNFKMTKEWRFLDLDMLPDGIPKKPEKTYKNKGWINYHDWLGIDRREKISYGEKIVYDYLMSANEEFLYNKSLMDCKNESKLRFDFFIPKKNICIEYDGIQHFKSIDFFGGDEEFIKVKKRDMIKNLFCEINKIKLIRLSYNLTKDEIFDILKKEVF